MVTPGQSSGATWAAAGPVSKKASHKLRPTTRPVFLCFMAFSNISCKKRNLDPLLRPWQYAGSELFYYFCCSFANDGYFDTSNHKLLVRSILWNGPFGANF